MISQVRKSDYICVAEDRVTFIAFSLLLQMRLVCMRTVLYALTGEKTILKMRIGCIRTLLHDLMGVKTNNSCVQGVIGRCFKTSQLRKLIKVA